HLRYQRPAHRSDPHASPDASEASSYPGLQLRAGARGEPWILPRRKTAGTKRAQKAREGLRAWQRTCWGGDGLASRDSPSGYAQDSDCGQRRKQGNARFPHAVRSNRTVVLPTNEYVKQEMQLLLVFRLASGPELPRRSGQDRRARPAKLGTAGPCRGATLGKGRDGVVG